MLKLAITREVMIIKSATFAITTINAFKSFFVKPFL